jgi:anti-sigma-K factor RskA
VRGHVSLQLRAVGEGVAAVGAAEVVLALLVAVLDVLLQGRQPLVAPVAVRAGQELGEVVRRAAGQV